MTAHPITLTVSPGRSGTTFLANTFRDHFQNAAEIHHEFLWHTDARPAAFHRRVDATAKQEMLSIEPVRRTVEVWARESQQRPVVDFGWTMRGLIPVFQDAVGDRLRVLVVHRHPVSVAASFAAMGNYARWNAPSDHLTPDHPQVIHPQFRARWPSMTPYERMLFAWLETTAAGLEWTRTLPAGSTRVEKAEGFFAAPARLGEIAAFCGLPGGPVPPSDKRNEVSDRSRESYPVGDEWQQTFRHPEVIALAESLGHDMSEPTVRRLAGKYRLPDGLGPRVRHLTRYWVWRNRAGNLVKWCGGRWAGAAATRPETFRGGRAAVMDDPRAAGSPRLQ